MSKERQPMRPLIDPGDRTFLEWGLGYGKFTTDEIVKSFSRFDRLKNLKPEQIEEVLARYEDRGVVEKETVTRWTLTERGRKSIDKMNTKPRKVR